MGPAGGPALPSVSLDDRYDKTEGRALLSGVQALLRLALEQRRADRAAGLNTGGFITGYPGSPLAGLDLELTRRDDLLADNDIVHRPGLNEELAATAIAGSQLSVGQATHTRDGVFALWYGKAPGLDRASDALRHGNLMGTGPLGGVLVCVGDDPQAKSSSVPSTSEPTLFALAMPILTPSDPQEILELGLHGFALSRLSGLWVGLRIPATVADCTQSVDLRSARVTPVAPDVTFNGVPFAHQVSAHLLGAKLIELESSLYGERLAIARRYGMVNELNVVTARSPDDRLGVVAAGSTYREVVHALSQIGLAGSDFARGGVRLLKVAMPYPLDEPTVREFAAGLDEVLVVEDKRPFLENLIKAALYGTPNAPRVVGENDERGRPLVPVTGEVVASTLAPLLAERVLAHRDVPAVRAWQSRTRTPRAAPLPVQRGAYFCSGCPHNTGVRVPAGTCVGSGSGCHGLAIQMDPRQVGTVVGRFQMGGEGAMWNGMSPFVSAPHFTQNIGDGTLAHSGSLAIRAAVASNVNITFKILNNATVAMTGGQPITGGRPVADTTRELLAEGVRKIIVTTDDPGRRATKHLPVGVELWPRQRIIEAQRHLAAVGGVTVLLHDQPCAAELRRKRKGGQLPQPAVHVHVNTEVCEACGDCGAKSNCLSVRSVPTRWGAKTQIHQDSCNFDYSCLAGDCPALVTVRRARRVRAGSDVPLPDLGDLDPVVSLVADDPFTMRLTGIGGTGVLTVAQVVAMAAHLEGRSVLELDQTGIAQKGGAVVSDLRISATPSLTTPRLSDGECDLYFGCDILVATTSQNLDVAEPSKTVAVVSTSSVPTGRQVADPTVTSPPTHAMAERIADRSRAADSVWLDANQMVRAALGSDAYANMLLLGAAYQAGALPIGVAALERAIELNGVAVANNLRAFRLGRRHVADLRASERHVGRDGTLPRQNTDSGGDKLEDPRPGGTAALVEPRAAHLVDYQSPRYARGYREVTERACAAENAIGRENGPFGAAVAVQLHRLMAHKDEYEVARLHLTPEAAAEVDRTFGPGARVTYHVAPPLLASFGVTRKVPLRRTAQPTFRVLRRMRRLRGTPWDPFGHTRAKRQERSVRDSYIEMIERLSAELTVESYERAGELAALPAIIRGFGDVRDASLARYEDALADLPLSQPTPHLELTRVEREASVSHGNS